MSMTNQASFSYNGAGVIIQAETAAELLTALAAYGIAPAQPDTPSADVVKLVQPGPKPAPATTKPKTEAASKPSAATAQTAAPAGDKPIAYTELQGPVFKLAALVLKLGVGADRKLSHF